MPEVEILIGGRSFQVACQEGEERFLQSAAKLLDNEAQLLADTLGRVSETRMLLMTGLMLADKTAGLEEGLRSAERKLRDAERRGGMAPAPAPAEVAPGAAEKVEVRVEVPVVPEEMIAVFANIADRAEEVTGRVEVAATE